MGVMERKTVEGHGAAAFAQERMFFMSDRAVAFICESCGSVTGDPPLSGKEKGLCRECNEIATKATELPYSTITLFTYLRTAGLPCHPHLEEATEFADTDSETDEEEAEWFEGLEESDGEMDVFEDDDEWE